MNTNQEVWFVTGDNKGLGAAIAKEALASDYRAREPGACRPDFANADTSMQFAT